MIIFNINEYNRLLKDKNMFRNLEYLDLTKLNINLKYINIPPKLKYLLLPSSMNEHVMKNIKFPNSLILLKIGDLYNGKLPPLPQNIINLYIGNSYNTTLPLLPSSLKTLYIGDYYNKPLFELKHTHLEVLVLGNSFNQILPPLPNTIKHIIFGYGYNKELPSIKHLIKLKSLCFSPKAHYKATIKDFPPSLRKLIYGQGYSYDIDLKKSNIKRLELYGREYNIIYPPKLKYLKSILSHRTIKHKELTTLKTLHYICANNNDFDDFGFNMGYLTYLPPYVSKIHFSINMQLNYAKKFNKFIYLLKSYLIINNPYINCGINNGCDNDNHIKKKTNKKKKTYYYFKIKIINKGKNTPSIYDNYNLITILISLKTYLYYMLFNNIYIPYEIYNYIYYNFNFNFQTVFKNKLLQFDIFS